MLERRILEGSELHKAMRMMTAAAEEAINSGCRESKRGVVFEREGRIVSRGHNTPAPGYNCVPQACSRICGDWTIHAEINAILDAANHNKNVIDTRGYHVKVNAVDVKMSAVDANVNTTGHLALDVAGHKSMNGRHFNAKEMGIAKTFGMIPADGPSCFRCAGIMYKARVKDFVLLEQEGSDIVCAVYPTRLFAQLSFRNDKRLAMDEDAIKILDMYAKR